MTEDWIKWLQYFYSAADFGPADGDVRDIIYENFKNKYGITIPELEYEE